MTTPYKSPASRWQAVTTRDKAASTAFIYCVKTTKIACRPGCPSRTARRANVEFCDTFAEAQRRGYRACLRCGPDDAVRGGAGRDPKGDLVRDACALMKGGGDVNGGEVLELREVARRAGVTRAHFWRVFREVAGVTPGQFRRGVLAERRAGRGTASLSPGDSVASSGVHVSSPSSCTLGEVDWSSWVVDDFFAPVSTDGDLRIVCR